MTLPERIVEAAARASVAFAYNDTLATDDDAFALWCANNPDLWRQELRCARAALTAALAMAEGEGAGLFVVPEEAFVPKWDDEDKLEPWFQAGETYGSARGRNACRAATLAGRVTL